MERSHPSSRSFLHSLVLLLVLGLVLAPSALAFEFERTLLVDDIVHYRTELKVGPGEHDRIGLHRIVRERAPYRPISTRESVLIAHGVNVGFVGTFLPNLGVEGADPSHSLPVFLAQNDVDVWALDFRWVLVPADVADLSFMADWGIEQDARDLKVALSAARWGRIFSGSGGGKIDLLGYSRGARISYAYLNDESQRPKGLRHVKRFVAFDGAFKTLDEELALESCDRIDEIQALIDAGQVADDIRFLAQAGEFAQNDPDGASPFFPGFTHRQTALAIGTLPPGGSGTFHLFAGLFDSGHPVGLAYTEEAVATNLLASSSAFQPLAGFRDLLTIRCNDGRSELDDHLDEISVPVFFFGAAGGVGTSGLDTLPFLTSSETESQLLRLLPEGQELFDVGHGDILAMDDAPELVWTPVLEFLTRR